MAYELEAGLVLLVHGWSGRGTQMHALAKECHKEGMNVSHSIYPLTVNHLQILHLFLRL